MSLQDFLSRKHKYGSFDCIQLVKEFYKNELNIDFTIPTYTNSNNWIKDYSKEQLSALIEKYAIKIEWSEIKNYDLLVFKTKNVITHFGIYIAPFRFLHIEADNVSKLENLNSYWIDNIYAVYRHKSLV